MVNAKNQIQELLAGLGLPLDLAVYSSVQAAPGGLWTSTVVLTLPGRAPIRGIGRATRKSQADIAAAEDVMAQVDTQQSLAGHEWALIYAEAQAGDALLKLAGYLAPDLGSPEERSRWLQSHESDSFLAGVFDRWLEEGDADLLAYGRGLGEKNKATLVEALLWRRFGARVLGPMAGETLGELRKVLLGA